MCSALNTSPQQQLQVLPNWELKQVLFFFLYWMLWTGAFLYFYLELYLRTIMSNQSIPPVNNCYNKDKNIFTLATKNQFAVSRRIFWDILQMTYSIQLSFNASSEVVHYYLLFWWGRYSLFFFCPYTGTKIAR